MHEPLFCKEGRIYLLLALLLAIALYFVYPPLACVGLILLLFFSWFFRNPARAVTISDDVLVSPADGKVMMVSTLHDNFINGEVTKITIFLSVFNVHVNRTPGEGVVKYKQYHPGKFLPAYKPHAAEENERCTIGVEMPDGFRYKVRQITGILARRIVCDVREGDVIAKGSRFGMIKFGSCTELIVPSSAKVLVKPGDVVRGNLTPIVKKG